ncbi:MAG: type II toxin-antitoxin system prevent-host-death family antitoxin [Albidovulum sp.]|uniref:type II toxin-antitoxin system prevent-host-death family antitoxin n=1 Tax=Albidovulum sp. TaxID=1872424 RepID=UPI003CAB78E9
MASATITEEFPKTSMNRRAGDVWAAAAKGPVSLSDHGTSRFVVMTREQFDALVGRSDPRIARATADIPLDEAEELMRVLKGVLDADDEA